MAAFDNIGSARLIIALMKLTGLWSFKGHRWDKYYRLYSVLLQAVFTFLFNTTLFVQIGMTQNMDDLSESLYMSITEMGLLVKVVSISFWSHTAVDVVDAFAASEQGRPRTEAEGRLVLEAHARFRRLRNCHIATSMAFCTIACLSALLADSYCLPVASWLPFDYRNDRNYRYGFSYVLVGLFVTATCNCTMDLFQAYLLFQLSVFYKLLGSRLDNYGYDGHDDKDEEALKDIFRFHQFIVSLTTTCEKLVSIPLLAQIFLSTFILCFTAFKLQALNFMDDPGLFANFVLFAGVMTLQILIPCMYGDELTASADRLTNAAYNSNWPQLAPSTRRTLRTYMEYLKRPVVVRAGNFFEIGLGVFTQTMKNAYRLYALILNVDI